MLGLLLLLSASPPSPLVPAIGGFVKDAAERKNLLEHAEAAIDLGARKLPRDRGATTQDARDFLEDQIARNLEEKAALEGFSLAPDDVRRRVIDYEILKAEIYVRAGVFPKRYFGYFDLRWDTAKHEEILRDTVRRAVDIINRRQAELKRPVRLTDIETAVTFIAEGGALLLRERQDQLESVHPVYGVGLDDIALGFARRADLVQLFDSDPKLGSRLREIVIHRPDGPVLGRYMSFVEAVLGTALMLIYEKELAQAALLRAGRAGLETMDLTDQFIVGSLYYNAGLLFSAERVAQIRRFDTAAYLARLSEQNAKKRWPLDVPPRSAAVSELIAHGAYREQPTTWSAVVHILQRYGAFHALLELTDTFDRDGRFRSSSATSATLDGAP